MRLALLVALLPALAGGGDDAEKLFRAVEKKLASAKSLRVVSSLAVQLQGKDLMWEGSLEIDGDKMRMRFSGRFARRDLKITAVSDGKKLRLVGFLNGDLSEEGPVPTKLRELATKLVSRIGLTGSLFIVSKVSPRHDTGDLNPDKLFTVHGFKRGKAVRVSGRDTKVLHYRLDAAGQNTTVVLWVDARTLVPVKRLIDFGKEKIRVVETYTEFQLDPKLDAKTFELPKS